MTSGHLFWISSGILKSPSVLCQILVGLQHCLNVIIPVMSLLLAR
jgi:hypothetical protein